ncbi:MAG: DUF1028 domain-containing protein [Vicinamibacterales bacterium]
MRRGFLVLLCLWAMESMASATWSVVAIDRSSGVIVVSSATCVPQNRLAAFPAKGLMDIQAIVVPGTAVAAAQAGVDRTRQNQMLIYRELRKGTPPDAIVAMLSADPAFETRQFGIIDRQGRTAGHSGAKNNPASLHRAGGVDGTAITYSIQGNILAGDAVVEKAVEALKGTSGSLADRVMAAMEAADREGGDKRCTCDTEPKTAAPCTAKTAHVAYILEAHAEDANVESFNDGRYAMYINVTDEDIQSTENANPVRTLRLRYDMWKKLH